jgi:phosphatidylglycerol---prolipoprotein diacylglyceryl transferase
MLPVLFSIGPIHLYTYGFFIALGFLAATFLIWKYSREAELDEEKIFDAVFISLFFGLLGARIYYILLHSREFAPNLIRTIHLVNFPGLAFHGGLILGFMAVTIFFLKQKIPFWKAADILALGLSLGQAITRLGCFFNGCCYGLRTNLFWGVNFVGLVGKRHPTQIYEALLDFLIFYLLLSIYKRHLNRLKEKPGRIILLYLILSSLARFAIEFLRGDSVYWQGFRLAQVISGLIFLTATAIAMIKYKPEIKNWLADSFLKIKNKFGRKYPKIG